MPVKAKVGGAPGDIPHGGHHDFYQVAPGLKTTMNQKQGVTAVIIVDGEVGRSLPRACHRPEAAQPFPEKPYSP